jgi:hypothetical protein
VADLTVTPEPDRVLDGIVVGLDAEMESDDRMQDLMVVVKVALARDQTRHGGSKVLSEAGLDAVPEAAPLRPLGYTEADDNTWVITAGNCSRPAPLWRRID